MPALPRHLQLTGGDYFIHAIDRQMRRAGMPGNVCRMIVSLEGRLDAALLRHRLAASPLFDWLARVRMIRLLPVLSPLWRAHAAPPPPLLHEHEGNGADGSHGADDAGLDGIPRAIFSRELRAGQAPALTLDLVRHAGDRAHLILSWHHALLDARGAELLLRHLADAGAGAPDPAADLINPAQTCFSLPRLWRGYPRKLSFARESLAFITSTCRAPFFTLMPAPPPARRAAAPGRNESRAILFTRDETARIDARCFAMNASFRRSHFYLAATVQGLHAVASRRGNQDAAYVIPVPHDLRRRGAAGPIFSNQLSFLFYRIEPALAASLPEMIRELTRQMMDQMRHRNPDSFLAAMELFKPTPLDFYVRQLGRPTGGKFATFFFSDAGESCPGLEDLAGARPTAITHLAPASRPPGLTVVFSRFRGRVSVVLAWVDDCLAPPELDELEAALRAALLGEAINNAGCETAKP